MPNLTVTLPDEMIDEINRKVTAGEFSSASEFIKQGIEALRDREVSLVKWLREEVVAGHEEFLSNPEAAVPANRLIEGIRRRREARRR